MSLAKENQLLLNLGHRSSFEKEDFLISACNRDAISWVDMWKDWPASALVIYGSPSCGKTHLAYVWKKISEGMVVDSSLINEEKVKEIIEQEKPVAIDGIDSLIENKDYETMLFHIYNGLKEKNIPLLLTMRIPPVRQNFHVKDLASRIRSLPSAHISDPDEDLLSALLAKMFSDRQINVGFDVIEYTVKRMERSFERAYEIVNIADKTAMISKRPVTVSIMRDILRNGDNDIIL